MVDQDRSGREGMFLDKNILKIVSRNLHGTFSTEFSSAN